MGMKNIKEAFGRNLREIRKSKNLTIESLSEKLEITPRQLAKIESGETFLTSETLCKISVVLDVSLKVLFDIDWYDKQMYYDDGKYIHPHFKVIKTNDKMRIKNLPALKGVKINKIIDEKLLIPFMLNYAKMSNITLYVECFTDKTRDKVAKIMPNGNIDFLITRDDLIKEAIMQSKDANYFYIIERIKRFALDKPKLEYLKTAIEALSDKKALIKLKAIISGIEISKRS
jgi:transcriptional regulator with XRE-family HTH domain